MQREITSDEAQKLDKLAKALKAKFKKAQEMNREIEEVREKEYQPITTAIQAAKDDVKDYAPITSAITNLENSVKLQLAPFQKALTYLPPERKTKLSGSNDGSDDDTIFGPDTHSTPTQSATAVPDESNLFGMSDDPKPRQEKIQLGTLATKYLPRAEDSIFGIYYNTQQKTYMVGNQSVRLDIDDLIINKRRYVGTPGLWRLLTYKKELPNKFYSPTDLENYKQILIDTASMYQNNNPTTNKPKSNKGVKWATIVEPIWKQHTGKSLNEKPASTGSGVLEYTETPIEYKYIDNLNELLGRMCFISSQEKAGNNNFHNEKMAILNFFHDKLEEIIDTPRAMEYMIRLVLAMPSKFLKDEKIGSGLFNTILKNIPFEMHVPGYNFLGPGTHLDKRLEKGHVGVNKLDEAAKEHDIFYKNHLKTSDRHVADKVLQDKAWERVKSTDADMNERLWSLSTAAAMKMKRTFGMGIVEPKLKFQL